MSSLTNFDSSSGVLDKLSSMISENDKKPELNVLLDGDRILISLDGNNTIEIGNNIFYNLKSHQYEDREDNDEDEENISNIDDDINNERLLDFDDNLDNEEDFLEYIVSEYGTEDLYIKYFDLYIKYIIVNDFPERTLKAFNKQFINQLALLVKTFEFDEYQFDEIIATKKYRELVKNYTQYLLDNSDDYENVDILCKLISCDYNLYLHSEDISVLSCIFERNNYEDEVFYIEECMITVVKNEKWDYFRDLIMKLLKLKRTEIVNLIDSYGDETLIEELPDLIEESNSEIE